MAAAEDAGTKYLLCMDGSDHSQCALKYLGSIVVPGDSVHVLCVIKAQHMNPTVATTSAFLNESELDVLREFIARKTESAKAMTEDAVASLTAACDGVTLTNEVAHGAPVETILARSQELATDIIALGSRGLGQVKRLILGSVSQNIVQGALCSVLVVKSDDLALELPEKKTFVCAIDNTSYSQKALEMLTDRVASKGDHIKLLSIHVPFIGLHDDIDALLGRTDTRNVWMAEAILNLQAQHQPRIQEAGFDCTAMFRSGDARSIICDEVEADPEVNMLVLGARGAGALERMIVGSVSTYCLNHASVAAVLIVHSQPEDEGEGEGEGASKED